MGSASKPAEPEEIITEPKEATAESEEATAEARYEVITGTIGSLCAGGIFNRGDIISPSSLGEFACQIDYLVDIGAVKRIEVS